MNHEEPNQIENVADAPDENLNPAQVINDEAQPDEEIERLPVQSIGSYARLEELLTGEEKENTTK